MQRLGKVTNVSPSGNAIVKTENPPQMGSEVVDENLNVVGTLPENFPMDSRTESVIHFGKWESGVPTEIRVDIYDPTVSGDHYYSPLIWNEKDKRYHMSDKEPKSGHRPKR